MSHKFYCLLITVQINYERITFVHFDCSFKSKIDYVNQRLSHKRCLSILSNVNKNKNFECKMLNVSQSFAQQQFIDAISDDFYIN